jgi:folate-binding protein YgfZ
VTRSDGQSFVLDTDGGLGEALAEQLLRFKLRSKVELEHLDWRCLSLRGAAVEETAAGLLAALGERGVLTLPFEWNRWRGIDLLGPKDVVLDASELPEPIVRCGADAVEACRIASGIPAMGAELTEKTIPAEAGLVSRTVDFDKGCYTGQELVARIDARGSKVPRRLVGIVATDDEPLARGMTLHAAEAPPTDGAADDKILGTITSAAASSELGAPIALAYLHRSVASPGPVRVRSGDGVGGSRPALAKNLPLVGGEGADEPA